MILSCSGVDKTLFPPPLIVLRQNSISCIDMVERKYVAACKKAKGAQRMFNLRYKGNAIFMRNGRLSVSGSTEMKKLGPNLGVIEYRKKFGGESSS